MSNLYRVTCTIEVEADDEDHAFREAMNELPNGAQVEAVCEVLTFPMIIGLNCPTCGAKEGEPCRTGQVDLEPDVQGIP